MKFDLHWSKKYIFASLELCRHEKWYWAKDIDATLNAYSRTSFQPSKWAVFHIEDKNRNDTKESYLIITFYNFYHLLIQFHCIEIS